MRQLSRLARLPLQRHKASAWAENAKVLDWSRRFSAISAAQVKELREKTGASMGKCREALKEENGDLEKALLSLGLDRAGTIVELRAETDFVTRSELFQQTLRHLAQMIAAAPDDAAAGIEAAMNMQIRDGPNRPPQLRTGATLSEALLELGSVLGEKLVLGNVHILSPPPGGIVAGYVHPKSVDSMQGTGRMAGLVSLRSPDGLGSSPDAFHTTASRLARHIVAAQPRFVSVDSIPAETLRKEREVFKAAHFEQIGPRMAGTITEEVLKKVLDGKTNKFYQEYVLACQELVSPQRTGTHPWAVALCSRCQNAERVLPGFAQALE